MEVLDELNFRVRSKFMSKLRSDYIWSGLFPIIVLSSSNMFLWILKDQALKGVMIYLVTLLVCFIMFFVIHYGLFGRALEESYQWGNEDFDEFEELMLDRFYIKGEVDDKLFYDYFEENDRENYEEDFELYRDFIRRGSLVKWVLSLSIALGSCLPTLLALV